jgi:ribosomal protein L11 methyltransferase
MKDYILFDLKIEPVVPGRDILLALLDQFGFDSFEETAQGLKAYILEEELDREAFNALPIFQSPEFRIEIHEEKLNTINWNEEWERNYEPIEVAGKLYIRAPFHAPKPELEREIVIEPKMSFGTGHHFTTRLMASMMFKLNFQDRSVLDMGTGTGILAILAEQLGAKSVLAIDNFAWAVENTVENAERNQCRAISALEGDAALLPGRSFEIILANINRNVLLEDTQHYASCLKPQGILLLSGFFKHDFELIDREAQKQGLEFKESIEEHNWLCCCYVKP